MLDEVPGACKLLLVSSNLATLVIFPSNSFYPRNVSDLLCVQVGLSNQVILNITKQEAVLASLRIYKVTQALRVIELRVFKTAFHIAYLAVANLLNELIRVSIEDQIPVV